MNKEATSKKAMAHKALHVITYGKVRSWEVRADFMTIEVAVPSWASQNLAVKVTAVRNTSRQWCTALINHNDDHLAQSISHARYNMLSKQRSQSQKSLVPHFKWVCRRRLRTPIRNPMPFGCTTM